MLKSLLSVFILMLMPVFSFGAEENFEVSKEYKEFYRELDAFRKGDYGRYDRFFRDVRGKRSKFKKKEIMAFADFGLGYLAFEKNRNFDLAKTEFDTALKTLFSFEEKEKNNFWTILDGVNLKINPEDIGKLVKNRSKEIKPTVLLLELIAQIYEASDTAYSIQNSQNIRTLLLDRLESADIMKNVQGHKEIYEDILKRMTNASKRLQELTPAVFDTGKAQQ